ncbi:hypothetical protein IU429_29395 [Nocardia elegans]|uniref:Uncharacterized protein n=1 Tax=Nocardia elegans TaxID=300029 RepID=A0ABW6TQ92_9NOCA|nr:hypothetical protein [Nocardia elegans]MBF6451784.1 hypothetical protein [Nocardia elegans]
MLIETGSNHPRDTRCQFGARRDTLNVVAFGVSVRPLILGAAIRENISNVALRVEFWLLDLQEGNW